MSTKIGRTEYVTATEAAQLAGIARDTFTSYVSQARAMKPAARRASRVPVPALEVAGRRLYKLADVRAWIDNRPGQGARTDLVKR